MVDLLIKFFLLSIASLCCLEQGFAGVYDVMQFGAVGDGVTDDTLAFLQTWGVICKDTAATPTMIIPFGMTFYLSPIQFQGPCSSPTIHFQLSGTITAPTRLEQWQRCPSDSWISFSKVNGLIIDGCGVINGQGSPWWSNTKNVNGAHGCNRPTALHFSECNGLQLIGIKHLNSPKNHISVTDSNNVDISNLYISAPPDSPNTDGIDISSSTLVHVRDSMIQTGDDCIAINSGSSNISITGVQCGPGHGIRCAVVGCYTIQHLDASAMFIGSLGANGAFATVEGIYVQYCNLSGTDNGARIKTWQGGSGYARNINFEYIMLQNVKNPIIIDQFYCPDHNCGEQPKAVKVSDVTYRYVMGSSATKDAIVLQCSKYTPCENIVLDQIDIWMNVPTEPASANCKNVLGSFSATNPGVDCLVKQTL